MSGPFRGPWAPAASRSDRRRWVHKTANVLNKLPASLQGKAKQDLHAIYEAANRKEAEQALDRFVAKYGAKYDKAVACLSKDRESLLAFYDFPAEHWKHVRTTDVIDKRFVVSGRGAERAPQRPPRVRRRRALRTAAVMVRSGRLVPELRARSTAAGASVVLWCSGTGDRVANSEAAAGSLAGLPDHDDPAEIAAPVRLLTGFGRHCPTNCS